MTLNTANKAWQFDGIGVGRFRLLMSASAPASTRDAVLSLLLERGEEDAGALADAVGISVQAMRRHLRSLANSGLVCASSNASGPGRPSNRWCLTDEGRAQFPDGSGRFALGLLDSMRSHLPEATVRQLLNQQAESKASQYRHCLLYTSPSPRDMRRSRMPSSA